MMRAATLIAVARHAAGFSRGGLPQRSLVSRALSAAVDAAAGEQRLPVGEVVVRDAGVAVVRDAAGLGGVEVVEGSRMEVCGDAGTVVLARSPLMVVCLDGDAGASPEEEAALAARRAAARGGEASESRDAFLSGKLEADGDPRFLAGRCVDARGVALDGGAAPSAGAARRVFAEGLEQARMAPIDEFLSSGSPAVDLMVPWGKGQSVLLVGDLASRDEMRRLARTAAAADAATCVYATLVGGADGAAEARAAAPPSCGVVYARARASAFASECEAVLAAHAALSYGDALRDAGEDALVILDGLEPLIDLWRRSTRVATDAFGAANVLLGDDSECRRFLSALLQRAGRSKGGGSLSIVALIGDAGVAEREKTGDATAAKTVADFEAAGARESILARLRALDARGVALTDDVLDKIGLTAPGGSNAAPSRGAKRRAEAVELLTSIADAHVDVVARPGGGYDIDASSSLQRVGVGKDVGTDTRPAALRTLNVGNRLRLELAAATNEEDEAMDGAAADGDALVRAAAWRAALAAREGDPPRKLSDTCALAVAVQLGLFDGVEEGAAAAGKVDALLAAAPATAVDDTLQLSDADLGALKVAATLALQGA